jgi:hypothetical protein
LKLLELLNIFIDLCGRRSCGFKLLKRLANILKFYNREVSSLPALIIKYRHIIILFVCYDSFLEASSEPYSINRPQ